MLAIEKKLRIVSYIVVIIFVPLGALGGSGIIDFNSILQGTGPEQAVQQETAVEEKPEVEKFTESENELQEGIPDIEHLVSSELYSPVAIIDGPSEYPRDTQISFDGDLSYDPDGGEIQTYFWQFDDGTNSNERSVIHTYLDAGIHVIDLHITDDEGMIGSVRHFINILP